MNKLSQSEFRNRLRDVRVDCEFDNLRRDAERECGIAIAELVEDNYFEVIDRDLGPYSMSIANTGVRLAFHIFDATGTAITSHFMSFRSLTRIIRDYERMCESHYTASSTADPYRLQTIDMGRRATHDEGSAFLQERLASKFHFDMPTARRLFTLIVACLVATRANGIAV